MKRFVSLILSVCFLFSINTVSYAANISSRKDQLSKVNNK